MISAEPAAFRSFGTKTVADRTHVGAARVNLRYVTGEKRLLLENAWGLPGLLSRLFRRYPHAR